MNDSILNPPSGHSVSCPQEVGFTLVELMVVVAIVAILASVGMPAYINHVNRARQSEAVNRLQIAHLEMQEFYTDNFRYARTIGCLPSAGMNCSGTSYIGTNNKYSLKLDVRPYDINPTYYRIVAERKVYTYAATDKIFISTGTQQPFFPTDPKYMQALKWSAYKWLFQ